MMSECKKTDFSDVHVYFVEFTHENGYTEIHQIFGISIKDARERAQILKKILFEGFISYSKVRTSVYRRTF